MVIATGSPAMMLEKSTPSAMTSEAPSSRTTVRASASISAANADAVAGRKVLEISGKRPVRRVVGQVHKKQR
ncbi:MAG: hypothetical protein WAU86_15105 [Oricola sp.]